MSVYPSLEDMKVGQVLDAQARASQPATMPPPPVHSEPVYPVSAPESGPALGSVYPSLMDEYMGLRLDGAATAPYPTADNSQALAMPQPQSLATTTRSGKPLATLGMVAPISGESVGLQRAAVTGGVREVVLCKNGEGKVGLRLRAVAKGIFVQFVAAKSAAALGGIRFGDQILQVDGANVAGMSGEKVMELLRKANPKRIVLAVRDRPFERTITLHKDSSGHVGFTYRGNKITAIGKDSSAARNGLLIDHHFLEVNGQNVVEMKGKELDAVFAGAGQVVTLTIMPAFVYEHMMTHMAPSLVQKLMDHSVPDV